MSRPTRVYVFGAALLIALMALLWPQMEHYLVTSGYKCPYPFSVLLRDKSVEKEATVTASGLPTYTLDQLRLYVYISIVSLYTF